MPTEEQINSKDRGSLTTIISDTTTTKAPQKNNISQVKRDNRSVPVNEYLYKKDEVFIELFTFLVFKGIHIVNNFYLYKFFVCTRTSYTQSKLNRTL